MHKQYFACHIVRKIIYNFPQKIVFVLLDLKPAFFIIAATNDRGVNQEIAANASETQLVNCVSKAEQGSVYMPKIIRKGRIQVSVSTSGASPAHTKRLAENIEPLMTDDLAEEVDRLFEKRRRP
ncbi:NAD(P)-dependent oxidoreductase [Proteus mirabilis]|uniref:NAD(P)-dependent oxidoreductase n=1 Tax=Proteus mirabilis TaxID=584 RepID=UPI0027D254BA